MSFGAGSTYRLDEFARIREGYLINNEEARFDKPISFAGSYQYAGVAPNGSLTSDPVWSIIRVSYDGSGRKIREQFRQGIAWDDRAVGW